MLSLNLSDLFKPDTDDARLKERADRTIGDFVMHEASGISSGQTKALAMLPALLILSACIGSPGPVGNPAVPEPTRPVELQSYLGTWYEYGRYEAPFQRGCEGVTAEYSIRDDGKIKVVNSCYRDGLDGEFDQAIGRAKLVEGSENAKLKVSFFGPFYGDYWVLDRGEETPQGQYSWSIVGEPSGRYLWMLTREARPSAELRALLERRVKELGYDWSLVRPTKQPD